MYVREWGGTHAFLDDGKVERVDDARLPLWFLEQSPAVLQVDEHAEPVGGFGQSDEVVDLVLGRVAVFLLVGVGQCSMSIEVIAQSTT